MYLRINNFEKILEAPHPLYTCTRCDVQSKLYIIELQNDEDGSDYKVIIDRIMNKIDNNYGFRVESSNIANGYDYGVLQKDDLKNRTLLFQLLCHAIEDIKIK